MEDRVIRHAQPLAWLNNGVLAEHVATYQAFLEERRYALKTRRDYLCCVAHLAEQAAAAQDQISSVSTARPTA
jgi:hypothetical protein